ncbi:MAG: DUF192 domain-containing protein [Candidatus Kerfeldbacteria bacterium]|nr:DUF192 domain-containing protein [Candidatus Kerfeldbacteria bacterium]
MSWSLVSRHVSQPPSSAKVHTPAWSAAFFAAVFLILIVGLGIGVLLGSGTGGVIRSSPSTQQDDRQAITVGGVPLSVEIADTDAERTRGLMFRDAVPEGTGMLFVWPSDIRDGFWMMNTRVPLSIAFLDGDGIIVEIIDRPDVGSRRSTAPDTNYRYALEVPLGWFAARGIHAGSGMEFDFPVK